MTDQQLDGLLDAFFVEGTEEVADRVIDAALDEIDQTPQRRVGRTPRRFHTMKTPMRVAVAAVIGVIAVGGVFYAIDPFQPAIGPSASAGDSASPPAPSPSVVRPAGPSWTITGQMLVPRRGSATLLPDGTVLVAGGGEVQRAELFDPARGSWTPTKQMAAFTDGSLAALLPSGMVLTPGSQGEVAQLYDPSSRAWTTTGSMSPGLVDPAGIVVLRNGKVLVVGDGGSAQLYDPGSHVWSVTETMVTPRANTTITLLADGRVLAAGGVVDADQAVASAELYDPDTGSWTATGEMIHPRHGLTATLLPDGKVLVVGGHGCRDCGGIEPSTAELFDPATGAWTTVAGPGTQLRGHTATSMSDGTVLVVGGVDVHDPSLPAAESFDPVTGTWTATADPLTRHFNHMATLLADGRVLVVGGDNGNNKSGAAEIYDPGDR